MAKKRRKHREPIEANRLEVFRVNKKGPDIEMVSLVLLADKKVISFLIMPGQAALNLGKSLVLHHGDQDGQVQH